MRAFNHGFQARKLLYQGNNDVLAFATVLKGFGFEDFSAYEEALLDCINAVFEFFGNQERKELSLRFGKDSIE